jgi:hypothetical protein
MYVLLFLLVGALLLSHSPLYFILFLIVFVQLFGFEKMGGKCLCYPFLHVSIINIYPDAHTVPCQPISMQSSAVDRGASSKRSFSFFSFG